jgi:hypothetical protein
VFIIAGLNILWLGIYGYYIPASVRVGLFVPMVASTFTAVLIGVALTRQWRSGAPQHETETKWGTLSTRGYFALLTISLLVIWIMGLSGYRRSAVRLFWHVNEVMTDASPWAFTHTIGFAVNVISLNGLLFVLGLGVVLGLAKGARTQSEREATMSRTEIVTHP